MATWLRSQKALENLLNEADAGNPLSRSIPESLEELAQAQLDEPIVTNADCATALDLALHSMGIDLTEGGCAGRTLVHRALDHLRQPH